MMMTDRDTTEMAALDALLGDLSDADVPEISDALMARILADAEGVTEERKVAISETAPQGWRGWIADLGGWPAMGSLIAAGVAGVWIGVAPTGVVSDAMAGLLGQSVTLEVFPEVDIFGLEAEG